MELLVTIHWQWSRFTDVVKLPHSQWILSTVLRRLLVRNDPIGTGYPLHLYVSCETLIILKQQ